MQGTLDRSPAAMRRKRECSTQGAGTILLRIVAIILIATAGLKLAGVVRSFLGPGDPVLSAANPILPLLPERLVLLLTGLVEIAVAAHLWKPPPDLLKCCLVLQLVATFLVYRFALAEITRAPHCHCLGITTGPFVTLQADIAQILLLVLLFCGLLASAVCLKHAASVRAVPKYDTVPNTRQL